MNNLEKEIEQAILNTPLLKDKDFGYIDDHEGQAKAAASVAMRHMRDAFSAGGAMKPKSEEYQYKSFNDYLIAIGLTPTEPDTKETQTVKS